MLRVTSNVGTGPADLSLLDLRVVVNSGYQPAKITVLSGKVSLGMQSVANRFVMTFFSIIGSTRHDESFGTSIFSDILFGSSLNFGAVQTAAAGAVSDAKNQIIRDDNLSVYNDGADASYLLDSAVCTSVSYDPKEGIVRIYVSLTNKAGESYTYVLPANLEVISRSSLDVFRS